MDSALVALLALGINTVVILIGGAAFVLKLDNRVANLAEAINNFARTIREIEPVIHELREDTRDLKKSVIDLEDRFSRLISQ